VTLDDRSAAPDPRIGTTLGGYRIDGVAGRGGMGVVYRAWDPSLDRPVALKILPAALGDDEAFRARFLRETRLAAAIDHPNIIPIYEAGDDRGVLFLAMRLVDGVDLDRRLGDGPLGVAETVALLGRVAEALDVAHAGGLVHRDVKPANILVGRETSGTHSVYLTDFGLTKQRDSQSGLTRTGSFLGTVDYMAPEQIDGRPVGAATDQYALTATVYRCLTGHVPFERDTPIATAMAHLKEPPPRASLLRPDLPAEVDDVIARGMAKDPAERFPACRELIAALERAGSPPPATATVSTRRILPRAVVAIALIAAVAIAGSLAASGMLSPAATPSPSIAVVGTPSTTASPTPAPSSTAFPTAAEQKLLDTLPAALRATCVRGHDQVDLLAAGFTASVMPTQYSEASLACLPTDGPNGVWFLWYPTGATAFGAQADESVGKIGAHYKVPDGDCGKPPARGSWQSAGANGTVMCLSDGHNGQAWIYWSFHSSHVLAVATAPGGQYPALYRWWQGLTTFLK
jgi:serine/threonine protein kinase